MTAHITEPNFDPHKEAIEGAPVDPWPRDSRVTDDRVKAARRAEWVADDQWDGDQLRPGWVEHLPLVDDTFNPPYPPVRAVTVTNPVVEQHTGFGIRLMVAAVLGGVCGVVVLAAVGFAFLAGRLS